MKVNKRILIRVLSILVCVLLCFSTITYGAFVKDNFKGNIAADAEDGAGALVKIISSVLGVVRTIGAVVAIVIFMVVAIKYIIASAGEKADLKKYLTTYVIGGLILFGASGILEIIRQVLDKSL